MLILILAITGIRVLEHYDVPHAVRFRGVNSTLDRVLAVTFTVLAIYAGASRLTPHVKLENGLWKAGSRFATQVVQGPEIAELLWLDIRSSATAILLLSFSTCVIMAKVWLGLVAPPAD
jgi:hypothetical protein